MNTDILEFVENSSSFDLDTLEKRLRPKNYTKTNEENIRLHEGYTNYSGDGFLGRKETLRDLLIEHDALVRVSGCNYDFLADSLNDLHNYSLEPYQKNPNRKGISKFLSRFKKYRNPITEPITYKDTDLLCEGVFYYNISVGSLGGQCCPFTDHKDVVCEEMYTGGYSGFITDRELDPKIVSIIATCSAIEGGDNLDEQVSNTDRYVDPDHKLYELLNTNSFLSDMPRFAMVSDMHVHLIRHHHFFEGNDTPYRCDPRILIKAFTGKDVC